MSGTQTAQSTAPGVTHVDLIGRITAVDEKKRLVYAHLGVGPDKRGLKVNYEKSKPHVKAWSQKAFEATKKLGTGPSFGNVRAQHGQVVAGHLAELAEKDDVGNWLGAVSVTDDGEWKKVLAGDYTGVSWGADVVESKDNEVVINPVELSLVDTPRFPDASFTLIAADGSEKEVPFKADAEGAKEAAEDAEASVKQLLSELASVEGDGVSVITWEDAVAALAKVKWVIGDLRAKIAELMQSGEPAAPATTEAAAQPTAEPGATNESTTGEGAPTGDPAPDGQRPEVQGSVSATEFRAVQEQLAEAKAANEGLGKKVEELSAKLEKVASKASTPGRAPTVEERKIAAAGGVGAGGSGQDDDEPAEVLAKRYEKLIAQAEAGGMPEAEIAKMRAAAAEHVLKLQAAGR